MSNILSLANCATPDSVFNTGIPLCDLAKGKIKGIIYLDRGTVFTPSHLTSVVAFLTELAVKTTAPRGGRAYPILDLLNFEDNTGDPATGGVGNLSTATIVTSDAVPSFRFGYNGSEERHRRMSLMAGSSLDVLFVDDKFAVYGTKSGVNLKGFSVLQAYSDTSKFIVADAVNQYAFRLTLGNISEYRDQSAYVVTNTGILAMRGLVNAQMSELSKAANVVKVQIIADGGTNLQPIYGTAISALTFTAVDLQTGNSFTITSVANNATDDAYNFTLDSTAWTALASGDKVQINGPLAAALAAAGVSPYEFLPVIITKP
jgi:hypothetical protein